MGHQGNEFNLRHHRLMLVELFWAERPKDRRIGLGLCLITGLSSA